MQRRLLLVDPNQQFASRMQAGWAALADIRVASDFASARAEIVGNDPPDLLVTNLRLRAYNGLHLAHLAARRNVGIRSIVYSERPEAWLLGEIQAIGAFFERTSNLATAIPAYVGAIALPPADRRRDDAVEVDLPEHPNRRATDVPEAIGNGVLKESV